MTDTFPEIAQRELALLLRDYGFRLDAADKNWVRLVSETTAVEAGLSPRGEFEVRVSRLDAADQYAVWTYTGMVGTASVARLFEIAAASIRADPAILSGDQAFYVQLAAENRSRAEAWTAFYSGKGPQPTGRLPS